MKYLNIAISTSVIGIEKLEPTFTWLKKLGIPYTDNKTSLLLKVPIERVPMFLKNLKQKNTLYLGK